MSDFDLPAEEFQKRLAEAKAGLPPSAGEGESRGGESTLEGPPGGAAGEDASGVGAPLLTEDRGLGEPVALFVQTAGSRLVVILGGLAGVIVGVAIPVAFAVGAFAQVGDTATKVLVGVFGAVSLAVGLFVMYVAFSLRHLQVVEYPDGLAWAERGGATRSCRWDAIEDVWFTRFGGPGWDGEPFLFRAADGQGFNLGSLGAMTCYRVADRRPTARDRAGVQRVQRAIVEETRRRLLPRVSQEYRDGRTLPFGKLSLSREGVEDGRRTVSWAEIHKIMLKRGENGNFQTDILQRTPHGWLLLSNEPRKKVDVMFTDLTILNRDDGFVFEGSSAQVPNLHVLMPLLERMLKASRPSV